MGHKTLMSRGKKLFPGHTASPVPCGRNVFHGVKPSFTVGCFQPFSVEMSTLIQTTSRGSKWWERKVLGHSTLNGGTLVLDLLENLEFGKSRYFPALFAQHSSTKIPAPQDTTEKLN